MLVREFFEASQVWSKSGGKSVRKYRCTSGARKGRVMSSPAACNKPLNVHKSMSLKKTKASKPASIKWRASRTKVNNPASRRNVKLNKAVKPRTSQRKIR